MTTITIPAPVQGYVSSSHAFDSDALIAVRLVIVRGPRAEG
jgi:hypothetical protein